MNYFSKKLHKAREESHIKDPVAKEKFRAERRKFSRDHLADQVTAVPGVSDRGIEARRGDSRNKGAISHGYARVADPDHHKKKARKYFRDIKNTQSQIKPNLPKSEPNFNKTDLPGEFKPHYATDLPPHEAAKNRKQLDDAAKQIEWERGDADRLKQGVGENTPTLAINSTVTPTLTQTTPTLPSFFQQHSGVIPHDHPHREQAVKFIKDVWNKDKNEGTRLSNRYLTGNISPRQHTFGTTKSEILLTPVGKYQSGDQEIFGIELVKSEDKLVDYFILYKQSDGSIEKQPSFANGSKAIASFILKDYKDKIS